MLRKIRQRWNTHNTPRTSCRRLRRRDQAICLGPIQSYDLTETAIYRAGSSQYNGHLGLDVEATHTE